MRERGGRDGARRDDGSRVTRALVPEAENRSALEAIRSLHAIGVEVTAASDSRLAVGAWSRGARRRVTVCSPQVDGLRFAAQIEGALRATPHTLLLPGGDASLLAVSQARERLEPLLEAGLGLPPHAAVLASLDRRRLHRAAGAAGLPAPPSIECAGVAEAERAARELGFPVLVKPVRYEPHRNGAIPREGSRQAGDLQALRRIVPLYGHRCLVQRHQPGEICSFGAVAAGGTLLAACLSAYHRTWPATSGNAAFSETLDVDPELARRITALVAELGWEGIFELELIRDPEGRFEAIDFNPRVYGSIALAAAAGADLPALWARWMIGGEAPASTVYAEPGVRYRWEEGDLRHGLGLARAGRVIAAAGALRPKPGTVHPVARALDPAPLAAWTVGLGARALTLGSGRRAGRGGTVAVIGAGPHGLAVAAHLRAAGVHVHAFGDPMAFWRDHMPAGMLLRSRPRSSHLSDPGAELTLHAWGAAERRPVPSPLPLSDYLDYGRWFQRRAVPDLDPRMVAHVARADGAFALTLEDGDRLEAERVVVAAGLQPFPRLPETLAGLPGELVSHSSEHVDLEPFAGRRVVVLGAGQSALESAALLAEAGAEVEVVARAEGLRWLGPAPSAAPSTPPRRIWPLPPTDVGGRVTGWIAAAPVAWRGVPDGLRDDVAYRCIRPAGAGWLRDRLERVPITLSASVERAEPDGDTLRLTLSDGSRRVVDHVMAATGYQVDVARYPFLAPGVAGKLRLSNGYPVLGRGLESSVPGLHFVGAPAAHSFGPTMRFVVGSWYAAPAVAARVARRRPPVWAFAPRHVAGVPDGDGTVEAERRVATPA